MTWVVADRKQPDWASVSAVLVVALALVLTACSQPHEAISGERTPTPSADIEVADEDASGHPELTSGNGRNRVVAPHGADDAIGSASEPWRTLEHALGQLQAGDTLTVHGGTYSERIDLRLARGRPDAPVRVVAAPGETPVVRGLLWIRDMDYWHIDGLSVTWEPDGQSDEHMVKLVGGRGWTFAGAHVWGARSYAGILVAGEPADWTIIDSCVHDTHAANDRNQDHLLYVNSGIEAGAGSVEGNLLFGAPNGAGIKLGGSGRDSGGAANVTVRNNTIIDTEQSVLIGWRAENNVIEDNLLGRVGENYGAVRGYELSGGGNIARGNGVFDAAEPILNDEGFLGVLDGGGNTMLDGARFDHAPTCEGFGPSDGSELPYGHAAAPS